MKNKRFITLLTIMALLVTFAVPSFAAITTVVANDQGVNYEYDMKELNDSFLEYQIDPDSPGAKLYKAFMDKKVTAFFDDVQGYIDAADVDNAYLNAQMADEEFDTDNYTETKATKADDSLVADLQTVTIGEDGEVVIEPKEPVVEPSLEVVEVSAINTTKLKVEFNKEHPEAGVEPGWSEFVGSIKVFKSVNGGETEEIIEIGFFHDGVEVVAGLFLGINLPEVEPTTEDQVILYSVQLGDNEPVEANETVKVDAVITELTVQDVLAETDNNTKVVTVTADVMNAEEDAVATIEIFAVDEEGKLAEEATFTAEATIEEGKIEEEIDVKSLASEKYGDYKVVVTVTQGEGEEAEEVEGEFEFAIDFTAVDKAVKAVNEATTEITLDAALSNDLFADYDETLIKEYNDKKAAYLEEKELVKFETVAQVNDFIKSVNDAIANEADVEAFQAELKAEYAKGRLSFAKYLEATYNAKRDDDHLDAYIAGLFTLEAKEVKTVLVENAEEAQLKIDVANFVMDKDEADKLVKALFEADKLLGKAEDVAAAKTAVYALINPELKEDQEDVDIEKLKASITNAENILAARAAVVALFGKTEEGEVDYNVLVADQTAITEAGKLVEKLVESSADRTDLQGNIDKAQELLNIKIATEAVNALFVDVTADTKALAEGIGQAEIKAAKEKVNAVETEVTKTALTNLITDAQNLFDAIAVRLTIDTTSIVSNPSYKDKGRQLGYWVSISLNKGDVNSALTVKDTEDITIKLYNVETLLGEQSLNAVGYEKYADVSALGGTINVFGEYVATSWDHNWEGEITDIPTKVVATVEYKDGRIVEKELVINEEYASGKMKFFAVVVTEATTVEDMRNALVDFVVESNSGNGYLVLSNAVKLEVAELVLDAIAKDIEEKTFNFADADYVSTKLSEAMTAHANKLDGINGITSETTIVGVENALTAFEYKAYNDFTSYADRLEIAENFFNSLHDEEGKFVAPAFKTLEAIRTAIDAAIAGL